MEIKRTSRLIYLLNKERLNQISISQRLMKIFLCLEVAVFLFVSVYYGGKIVYSAMDYNGKLAWKLNEFAYDIKSEWEYDNPVNEQKRSNVSEVDEEESYEISIGECVISREDGSYTYFLDENKGWRLSVVDAAAGSRWYKMELSEDAGRSWNEINADPFLGDGGVADGMVFFDENYGYISMGSPSASHAEVYVTHDGGLTFSPVELSTTEMEQFVGDMTEYDYEFLPEITENGAEMILGKDVYIEGAVGVFRTVDNGVTWEFLAIKEDLE